MLLIFKDYDDGSDESIAQVKRWQKDLANSFSFGDTDSAYYSSLSSGGGLPFLDEGSSRSWASSDDGPTSKDIRGDWDFLLSSWSPQVDTIFSQAHTEIPQRTPAETLPEYAVDVPGSMVKEQDYSNSFEHETYALGTSWNTEQFKSILPPSEPTALLADRTHIEAQQMSICSPTDDIGSKNEYMRISESDSSSQYSSWSESDCEVLVDGYMLYTIEVTFVQRLLWNIFQTYSLWGLGKPDPFEGTSTLGFNDNQSEGTNLTPLSPDQQSSTGKKGEGSSTTSTIPPRKRRREDGEDGEEERNSKRKKKEPPGTSGIIFELPLACPFYKRDPSSCTNSAACSGPGWTEIHRLK